MKYTVILAASLFCLCCGCGQKGIADRPAAGMPDSDSPQSAASLARPKDLPMVKTIQLAGDGRAPAAILSSEIMPAAHAQEEDGEETAEDFQPFYIYTDKGSRQNHYVPSGFMPNGKCILLNDEWMESCLEGDSCIRVEYEISCSKQDQKWAGIYWLNPPNNWGHRKGGFNLTGARRLTFWARGEKGGEQIQEFTVGGIQGDYPDSDIAVIGPVILTSQWRQYTVDLRGKDLSYISGGFAWTTNVDVNPAACAFYLDEIRFE